MAARRNNPDKKHLIDFGKRIRYQRQKLKLSQERMAEMLDISQNFYGKVERGISSFSYITLKRAKDVFGVSIDYLLTGELESSFVSPVIEIINNAPEDKRRHLEELILVAIKLYK